MIFGLFTRKTSQSLIDALHGEIMAQARQTAFYSEYGVPDTLEGRFEMVALHGALAVRRLTQLPNPGPDMAQELMDAIFRHFDVALREIGVGDLTVPKRMKTLAAGFLGRARSYLATLDGPGRENLTQALARNVFGLGESEDKPVTSPEQLAQSGAVRLAVYVRTLEAAYGSANLREFLAGKVPAVDPAAIAVVPSGPGVTA